MRQAFNDAGADMYTFHLECPCFEQPSTPRRVEAVVQLARRVRDAGMNVGLALSPSTPAAAALPYLDAGDFDLASLSPHSLHVSTCLHCQGSSLFMS